jgi:dipeptidyl aminopeptidase/acylaminoacyl peptidase
VRPLTSVERDWLDLAWSPDGSRIAYVTRWTIYVVGADGSALRRLETGTEGHDRSPTWSPDGTRIAYAAEVAGEQRVYALRLADGRRTLVARDASFPAWSPDGTTIAYRGCGGVRLATPDGSDVTPGSGGCRHIGVDGAPVWSPDGRRIAMSLWKVGTFVMNADGSGLTRVGPSPANLAQPEVRQAWIRPAWRERAVAAFPTGTFRTKITAADLVRAGLDPADAHWETVTYRADGTWRDVWSHPTVASQPPETGRYVVHGAALRILGTPDTVRWRYANGALTYAVVNVPDRLARLIYTAHPWRRLR